MKTEIEYAVNFLTTTISGKLYGFSGDKLQTLSNQLTTLLNKRFEGHWYPEKPMKGSAYRCINISIDDGSIDAVLLKAVEDAGFNASDLIVVFSKGLALWVDPNDVSCKLGKGAIFPIYRKLADKTVFKTKETAGISQRRPQQRPRSISPPQSMLQQQQQYQRSRSTTPPGFSSLDAGQLFQSSPSIKPRSLENIHKLWDTLPNTSISNYTTAQQRTPVSYTSTTQSYRPQNDAVYSFNQYSSYYKPNTSYWKKNSQVVRQQTKPKWQSDDVYNRYHWSKSDASSLVNQTTYSSYSPSRQVQEVY